MAGDLENIYFFPLDFDLLVSRNVNVFMYSAKKMTSCEVWKVQGKQKPFFSPAIMAYTLVLVNMGFAGVSVFSYQSSASEMQRIHGVCYSFSDLWKITETSVFFSSGQEPKN